MYLYDLALFCKLNLKVFKKLHVATRGEFGRFEAESRSSEKTSAVQIPTNVLVSMN